MTIYNTFYEEKMAYLINTSFFGVVDDREMRNFISKYFTVAAYDFVLKKVDEVFVNILEKHCDFLFDRDIYHWSELFDCDFLPYLKEWAS